MSKYIELIDSTVRPVHVVGGAFDAPASTTPLQLAATLAGGAAGAMLWKRHRVLGFLGGAALGDAVGLVKRNGPHDRADIPYHLAVTGAGVALSLAWKRHPFWGFVLGSFGTALMTAGVPSSPAGRALSGKTTVAGLPDPSDESSDSPLVPASDDVESE